MMQMMVAILLERTAVNVPGMGRVSSHLGLQEPYLSTSHMPGTVLCVLCFSLTQLLYYLPFAKKETEAQRC